MNITPIYSFGYWFIEVETEEFGRVLLLDPNEEEVIPVRFDFEDDALFYIFEYKRKFNI